MLSPVHCFKTSSLPAFERLFYQILGHLGTPRGQKSKFWSKIGPVFTLSIPKTAQYWVKLHNISGTHCFFWALGPILITLGHLWTFTGAKGAFWGQNWPFSWPSGVPKWPKIGSTCRISFRLTPVVCLVVFWTFLEHQWVRLGFSPSEGLEFEHFWPKFWNGSKWHN